MERLTKRTADGVKLCFGTVLLRDLAAQDAVEAAFEKLAAYEDTGLEPSDIGRSKVIS